LSSTCGIGDSSAKCQSFAIKAQTLECPLVFQTSADVLGRCRKQLENFFIQPPELVMPGLACFAK